MTKPRTRQSHNFSPVVRAVIAVLFVGVGGGLAFPAVMTLAMSGATARDAGLASGVVTTMTQVGGAFGLAVLATLATARSDGLIADGQSTAAALTSGYQLAFGIGAGLILTGLALTASVLRPPAPNRYTDAAGHRAQEPTLAAGQPQTRPDLSGGQQSLLLPVSRGPECSGRRLVTSCHHTRAAIPTLGRPGAASAAPCSASAISRCRVALPSHRR